MLFIKTISSFLDHTAEKFVDVLLSVTEITTFGKVVGLLSPTAFKIKIV